MLLLLVLRKLTCHDQTLTTKHLTTTTKLTKFENCFKNNMIYDTYLRSRLFKP